MTATAFIDDPILEPLPSGHPRPDLRLVEGHPTPAAIRTMPLPMVPLAVPPSSVETYRRRRFLALVAATIVVLVVTQLAGISIFDFSPGAVASDEAAPVVHVVGPGDTYQAIAAELGAENPSAVADQLRAANGGGDLVVGQRLVVNIGRLQWQLTGEQAAS